MAGAPACAAAIAGPRAGAAEVAPTVSVNLGCKAGKAGSRAHYPAACGSGEGDQFRKVELLVSGF